MSTLSHLRHFLRRHDLLPPGARIIVGVSGGPDSLALLHALHALSGELGWHLHAAYLHHGLRAEAEAEALFVAQVSEAWGVGCTIEHADTRATARQTNISLEEAARQLRYDFLARVALRLGAGFVAVGHNADDQAETLLMHLLRGSGLAGLRGMLPSTLLADLHFPAFSPHLRFDPDDIHLVRPWLETPRADILAYCQTHGLQPRLDATNTDATFFRNRLRHEILPLLRQINPNLTTVLGHTAAALQGDYDTLERHRQELWAQLTEIQPGRVHFDLSTFRTLQRGDQRSLLRRAIATLRPDLRNIGWEHSERLLDLLAANPATNSGGPYPLVAGVTARLDYHTLAIVHRADAPTAQPQITEPRTLPLPGRLPLGPYWQIEAERVTWAADALPPWATVSAPNRIWLPPDIATPLIVRPRQPHDRIRLFGLGGSKALTDLMTELKLPRPTRPHWPLLIDATGDILWVIGQRAGEACRVTTRSAWEVRLLGPIAPRTEPNQGKN